METTESKWAKFIKPTALPGSMAYRAIEYLRKEAPNHVRYRDLLKNEENHRLSHNHPDYDPDRARFNYLISSKPNSKIDQYITEYIENKGWSIYGPGPGYSRMLSIMVHYGQIKRPEKGYYTI